MHVDILVFVVAHVEHGCRLADSRHRCPRQSRWTNRPGFRCPLSAWPSPCWSCSFSSTRYPGQPRCSGPGRTGCLSVARLALAWRGQRKLAKCASRGVCGWPGGPGGAGLGLIRVGPEDYLGRSWSDQFNYTAMAECFRRLGLNAPFDDIGQQPWLGRVRVSEVAANRTECLASVSWHHHAHGHQAQFMPTILLGCPLIALALYAAARNLGLERRHGAIAGLFGGLVPGVTLLVQESFLSQCSGDSLAAGAADDAQPF